MTAAWSLAVDTSDPKVLRKMSAIETVTADTGQTVGTFNGTMPAKVVPNTWKMVGDFATATFEAYETDAHKLARYVAAKLAFRWQLAEWRIELQKQEESVRISGGKKLDSAYAAGYEVDQDATLSLDMKILIHVEGAKGATDVDSVERFIPVAHQFQDDPVGAILWVGRDGVRTTLANAVNWGAYPGRLFHQVY